MFQPFQFEPLVTILCFKKLLPLVESISLTSKCILRLKVHFIMINSLDY